MDLLHLTLAVTLLGLLVGGGFWVASLYNRIQAMDERLKSLAVRTWTERVGTGQPEGDRTQLQLIKALHLSPPAAEGNDNL